MSKSEELSILRLTLKAEPFEVMVTGEKPFEYRSVGEWIERRLLRYDKSLRHYDLIEFRNGYGNDRPWFRCRYLGAEKVRFVDESYSNGLRVTSDKPVWRIKLGEIVATGNLEKRTSAEATPKRKGASIKFR